MRLPCLSPCIVRFVFVVLVFFSSLPTVDAQGGTPAPYPGGDRACFNFNPGHCELESWNNPRGDCLSEPKIDCASFSSVSDFEATCRADLMRCCRWGHLKCVDECPTNARKGERDQAYIDCILCCVGNWSQDLLWPYDPCYSSARRRCEELKTDFCKVCEGKC